MLGNGPVGGVKLAVYLATPFVIRTSSKYPVNGIDVSRPAPITNWLVWLKFVELVVEAVATPSIYIFTDDPYLTTAIKPQVFNAKAEVDTNGVDVSVKAQKLPEVA